MNTGTDTGKQQDNEKEGFTMRVRQNRKLLRRGLCIALVLLMLLNSIGVMAGSSDISVSNYDEFVRAMEQVGHLDTILIKGIVEIPCNSSVGFDDKVIVIKGAGGYINFDSGDYSSVKNIIFDGNAKELFNPFIRCYGSVSFIDCTFKDFRSSGGSGAVNVYADCDFTDCTFRNNKGAYGGNLGISSGLTKLKSCTLMGGEATVRGGGVYIDNNNGIADIEDCIIKDNISKQGGGIANWGEVTVKNTLLYDNTASIGGADLFSVGTYSLETVEQMGELYHAIGLDPVEWKADYEDLDYGAICLKLIYSDYEQPTTEPPEDTEQPTEEPTQEPESTEQPATEQPTTEPASIEQPTDPASTEQPASTEDPKEGNTDNSSHVDDHSTHDSHNDSHTEDNSTHDSSTHTDSHNTQDSHDTTDSHTEDNHTEDNSTHNEDNSTHSDSHSEDNSTDSSTHDSNNTTDNSVHNEDHSTHADSHDTTDNSSSTTNNTDNSAKDSSTHDNHSIEAHYTDNSSSTGDTSNIDNHSEDYSSRSDSSSHTGDTVSNTDNSTVNNTDSRSSTDNRSKVDSRSYTTIKESSGGSQNGSSPVTVSVPVDVHAPEEKGAENSPTAPAQPNINIYSDNVRVVYSTNPDGSYTVDLMDSKIIQPEVSAVDQSDNKNEPNWIDYVCMILLALLTFEGLQERIAKRRRA